MARSNPITRAYEIGLAACYAQHYATRYRNKELDRESRDLARREMHHAGARTAATASTHLADMRDKARVILALQEATGIIDSPSAYHALARSLARDVLARPSS